MEAGKEPRCVKQSPVNVPKVRKSRLPERAGEKGGCEESSLLQLEGGKIRGVAGRGLLMLKYGGELHEARQEEPLKEWGERNSSDPPFPEVRVRKTLLFGISILIITPVSRNRAQVCQSRFAKKLTPRQDETRSGFGSRRMTV